MRDLGGDSELFCGCFEGEVADRRVGEDGIFKFSFFFPATIFVLKRFTKKLCPTMGELATH